MKRLEMLCNAIQQNEGYYIGSRSWKNNNPGNLRNSPLAKDTRNGFATFETYAAGWAALWFDLWQKCHGRTTTGLTPNSSLIDFAKVWAPINDNNNPWTYANNLAKTLHIPTSTELEWFLADME